MSLLGGANTGFCAPPAPSAAHPLRSQRLKLRPLTEADVDALTRITDDFEVTRYTAVLPFPFTEDAARDFIAQTGRAAQKGIGVAFGAERILDGQLIGCVGWGASLVARENAELGYWFAKAFWGQGYAKEAVARLVRYGFEERGVQGFEAATHPFNPASRRALEAIGFGSAGTRAVTVRGQAVDVTMPVYGLARADWQIRHQARPMVLVVAAALIDGDGRVLMASRPAGKSMAGLWEFPGGKVAEFETPEQALRRELSEELGIDTAQSCMAPIGFASHDYDSFHLIMPLYAIRVWSGRPTAREGQGLKWVQPSKMLDLPLPPADIPLVAALRAWV